MKKIKILLTLLFFFVLDCKKKDWRDELKTVDYKEIHKDSLSKQKLPIQMSGGMTDRESAVHSFLVALKENRKNEISKFILSDEEYKEYFLPHTLGHGTSLDVTPMDQYWPSFIERKKMGMESLSASLLRSNGNIKEFHWRPETREYGPWKAWKLDSVVLETKNAKAGLTLEQIKLVACHKEKCKIAVIAP
ncbi:hypothetical protein LPTSP4_29650 [Leptospira ryugenii]|uniref:Uncharacterized protein n=1 Tax=Leptospira ryugenii TaxID=1917863 RepID=A0A2P2E3J7_9LEPT|nr:hypothetical protein [Leptospira ryugenii]GBF51429.1 hypothetical protein LPTSP4_29650 [Leptospira ryugenii]